VRVLAGYGQNHRITNCRLQTHGEDQIFILLFDPCCYNSEQLLNCCDDAVVFCDSPVILAGIGNIIPVSYLRVPAYFLMVCRV
jgi:hypothetical protein